MLHRTAENMSPKTLRTYAVATHQLRDFLIAAGRSTNPEDVSRADVQAFLSDLLARRAASTVATRYWALRSFYGWLVEEGEIEHSPLDRVRPPRQEERPTDVLSDDDVRALLHSCEGKGFDDRRDTALVRLMYDSGIRVGEVVSMTREGTDLGAGTTRVHGKGMRDRDAVFGAYAARDLSRYLRLRETHSRKEAPQLWLGRRGPLTESGVAQTLKVRASIAGIDVESVHPHALRHTWAHRMKENGCSEEDLMTLGGWRSPTVMRRYGSSLAATRAREVHRRLSPGDHL